MATAVTVRVDFSADELRRLAAASKHANQSRRLLSLAADGLGRKAVCLRAMSGPLVPELRANWDQHPHIEAPPQDCERAAASIEPDAPPLCCLYRSSR